MSERINHHDNRATIRWKLLTTASALALSGYVSSINLARAEDSDRPTFWIELGGQMEMMQGLSSPFTAPFMFITPTPAVYKGSSFTGDQRPPRFAFGEEGKITFQPDGSDWSFSAGIRYGRSHATRHLHHQTPGTPYTLFGSPTLFNFSAQPFEDIKALHSERHMVLDFSAGRDVGIGLLGRGGVSKVSAGVRLVDFKESSTVNIFARPSVTPVLIPPKYLLPAPVFHQYMLDADAKRSFKGVGPSLSWDASAALAGNKEDGELTLDWGINAAILFGKQKAKTSHATKAYYQAAAKYASYYYTKLYEHGPHPKIRSRNVIVPNVGGFAGLSYRYADAKISFGYRADSFFGAMDTGIDTAKKSNLTFNGPYASISIGLGD